MRVLRQWLMASLAACAAGIAPAAPITLAFTGTVAQAPNFDPADPFGGVIATGTAFSGRYTFDPAAADAVPDGATGSYASSGAPYGLTLSYGAGTLDVGFDELAIGIGNDLAGADFYTLASPLAAPADALAVSLILVDEDGSVFGADSLPAFAPTLADFETRQFSLFGTWLDGNGTATQIEILGTLDTLACVAGCNVPEPGGLALLGAGATAWLAGRRRQPGRP